MLKLNFAALLLLIMVPQAWSFNAQNFRLSHSFENVVLEDALHSRYSQFSKNNRLMFQASYNYVDDPLIAINSDRSLRTQSLLNSMQGIDLGISYFIPSSSFTNMLLGIRSQYIFSEQNQKNDSSLGETRISLKMNLKEEESSAFSLMPFIDLPTGSEQKFTSDDSLGLGFLFSYDKFWNDWVFQTNLGYKYSSNSKYLNIDLSSRIIAGLGARYNLTERASLGLEWLGEFGTSFEKDQNPTDLNLLANYKLRPLTNAFAGIGAGGLDLTNTGSSNIDSGDFRFFIGLKSFFGSTKNETVVYKYITKEVKVEIQKKLQRLKDVRFYKGTAKLTENSKVLLSSILNTLNKYIEEIRYIYIEGHTDSDGGAAENLKLSNDRARAIQTYLQSKGIDRKKIKAIGFGEQRPKVKENTIKDKAINRRVEFEIVYK